jgi:enoyl-CoA hydratase
MIEREQHGGVALVRLAHGKVSALDIELLAAIIATFGDLAADRSQAVVVTGAGSTFSAGVDLHRILDGGARYARDFVPVLVEAFLAVFACDKPVVAAVNGHAIAGGCILAVACDRRFMAAGGGRIGVSELAVGVPFPAAGLEILRHAVGRAAANDLVLTAAVHAPTEALARGLVHEVVPPDELLERSLGEARRLAGVPHATFRHTKRQLRRDAMAAIERHGAAEDADVLGMWASVDVHDAIVAFVERTVRRSAG